MRRRSPMSKTVPSLRPEAPAGRRVTGTFRVDDTTADGPKVDVKFDAALLKEVKTAM
jgi:hypothetical protein